MAPRAELAAAAALWPAVQRRRRENNHSTRRAPLYDRAGCLFHWRLATRAGLLDWAQLSDQTWAASRGLCFVLSNLHAQKVPMVSRLSTAGRPRVMAGERHFLCAYGEFVHHASRRRGAHRLQHRGRLKFPVRSLCAQRGRGVQERLPERQGYAAEAMARRRRQTMCSESVAEQLSGVDDVKTTQSVAEKREERQSDFRAMFKLFAWTRSSLPC